MSSGSPDDLAWLGRLVRRSPLLADRQVRQHWLKLLPWLPAEARYTLAAVLLEIEHACTR